MSDYIPGGEPEDRERYHRRQNGLAATYDAVKLSGAAVAMGGEPLAGAAIIGGGALADLGAAGYRQYRFPDAEYEEGWLSRPVTGTYHTGLERLWSSVRAAVSDD